MSLFFLFLFKQFFFNLTSFKQFYAHRYDETQHTNHTDKSQIQMPKSPTICTDCLGNGNDIRMICIPEGAECKLCTLTFDLYHFKKDKRSNTIIKTIICLACANQRNVCQCCMLDMLWHIPIDERDQLLSLIKGYNITTKEATNEMMKRFLVLKKGKKQIGGAAMMAQDQSQLDLLMQEMKHTLETEKLKLKVSSNSSPTSINLNKISTHDMNKFANINIHHLLDLLPLNESFTKENDTTTRFFVYNINPSLAEWKIDDKIAQLVDNTEWKDPHPLAMMINHKSTCGSINFRTPTLAQKFVDKLISTKNFVSCKGKNGEPLQRGVLNIDHFNLYVIPWIKDNFTQNSFGNNTKEYIKLSITLRNLIISEMKPKQTTTPRVDKESKLSKNKKKSKKKVGRVTSSFAL